MAVQTAGVAEATEKKKRTEKKEERGETENGGRDRTKRRGEQEAQRGAREAPRTAAEEEILYKRVCEGLTRELERVRERGKKAEAEAEFWREECAGEKEKNKINEKLKDNYWLEAQVH